MILKPFKGASTLNITQGFHSKHHALDWLPSRKLGAYGTPLVAPEKCVVKTLYGNKFTPDDTAGLKNGFGLWMEGMETGMTHLYWHTLPFLPVSLGDTVEKGQIVAYVGNSGNLTSGGKYVPIEKRDLPNFAGTHLHQQVVLNTKLVNPADYIDWNAEPQYGWVQALTAMTKTLQKMLKAISG